MLDKNKSKKKDKGEDKDNIPPKNNLGQEQEQENSQKKYKRLEEIITTNSTDYIKDLILQIKTISSFFNKIDSTSQNVYCKLSPEYKSMYEKVKNKLLNLTKTLCILTWKENSEINIDSYDDLVKNVEDLLEMVSRNIDIIKGRVKESPEEDISKELTKIKKEKLKNYNIAKSVNLDNDVFDIDNSYYPFIPKLSEKPNCIEPLDKKIIDATRLREENKAKLKLKYEDSKNKDIQKYLFTNPYTKEIEKFCYDKENELSALEEEYLELKENMSEKDNKQMKDEDEEEEEDGDNDKDNVRDDIIEFIEANSLEEKNKILKNKKNKNFIFCSINFKPAKSTKLNFIDTKEELDNFINIISKSYNEIAVDLEHHNKESYLGITCLIQISTRDEDYIIDAIKLRSYLNKLNVIFTNPNILKVFHGADYDILWLQRDFGIYVVNMFDTGRASRILSYESYSLKYLLHKFCDFEADKTYQLADWRIRPLTDGMIKYARNDTHFLLYIYDELKKKLILKSVESGNGGGQGIFMYYKLCIRHSCEVCLQSYQKPIVKDKTYYQYVQMNINKPKIELGIIKETYIFRDYLGRLLDRDPKELLKKSMIFKLSKATEFTIDNLLTIISFDTPFLRYLNEYIEVINAKIKKVQKKSENSFKDTRQKNELEYIKRVQKILQKSKEEEEKKKNNKNQIFLNQQKIKEVNQQIKAHENNIKINIVNTPLNTSPDTSFITNQEKVRESINNLSIQNINGGDNIFNNFNLVDYLRIKHGLSKITIKSSNNTGVNNNELGKKREEKKNLEDDETEFNKKTKGMKDLTNNERIIKGLKANYEMTKREIISESESDSESYEKEKDKNKRETKVQKKIREKEEKLKNFIKNNKESKYENERNYKYKGKKRK